MITSNAINIKFESLASASGDYYYFVKCRAPDDTILAAIASTKNFHNAGTKDGVTTFEIESIDDYRTLLYAIEEAIKPQGYHLLSPPRDLIEEAQNTLSSGKAF